MRVVVASLLLTSVDAWAGPLPSIQDAVRVSRELSTALASPANPQLVTTLNEAARIPWPLLDTSTDQAIATHLAQLDPQARQAWALDRALPILAGELQTTDAQTEEVLTEVARAARASGHLSRDMLRMDDARKAYAARQLNEAEARYSKVTQGSPLWPEALRERAWTLLLMGRPDDSLGATVALGAPYFPQEDHAEGRLLRATVLLDRCRYDEARQLVAALADAPVPQMDAASAQTAVVRNTPPSEPVAQRAWLSPLVGRVRLAIAQSATAGGDDVRARREAIVLLGTRLFQTAFAIEAEQVRQLKERALRVRYEAFRHERGIVEKGQALRDPVPEPPQPLQDDEVPWTFDGTYWRDELGSYRYSAGNACPQGASQ